MILDLNTLNLKFASDAVSVQYERCQQIYTLGKRNGKMTIWYEVTDSFCSNA